MFTYKIYVDTKRNNALMLRISNNRRKAELSTGFRIAENELSEMLAGQPGRKNQQLANLIDIWQGKIAALMIELTQECRDSADAKEIRDIVGERLFGKSSVRKQDDDEDGDKTRDISFAEYYDRFTQRKDNPRTKQIYEATMSRMKAYDPKLRKRGFDDINVRWLSDFDSFLMKTSPSQNARSIHFRNIRAVINAAIDEELTDRYPFRRFKIRTKPTRKRDLSLDKIRKIFNAEKEVELEDWEIKYLDFFKLSFLLIGINVVDLCNLTEINDGRIEYVRAKTHKLYSIKVEPEALELIEKYKGKKHLLNFTDNYSNYRHFYNNLCKGLNSIRKKLKIKTLTSYWARHTWSTIAADLDIPDAVISSSLGHAAENATTAIYIHRNRKKVDEANRRVLDWVLYGKR